MVSRFEIVPVQSTETKKAISRVLNPADGLGSLRLPEASDGAGYDDHNNPYYRDRRADLAADEAGGHCQKLQCTPKFRKCKWRIISEIFMPGFGLFRNPAHFFFLLKIEFSAFPTAFPSGCCEPSGDFDPPRIFESAFPGEDAVGNRFFNFICAICSTSGAKCG